jgi:glucosamine kinase
MYQYFGMAFLLVESGSTKTDWCFLQKGKKPAIVKTSGINPNLQTEDEIVNLIEKELNWDAKKNIESIAFYGAGLGNDANKKSMERILKRQFQVKDVEATCDMTAASRAMCGSQKGVVAILGTGSNACYYDGKKIKDKLPSLGYILGDEGSGNHMGKRVLQYYAYKTFDEELKLAFEQHFGNDLHQIIAKIYKEPFPNRYLATFVRLLKENRGHFMVENIIEDCLNDFFQHYILKLRQSWTNPLYFIGSVAYYFKDVIEAMCDQYELQLGSVLQSPLDGLIAYHSKEL